MGGGDELQVYFSYFTKIKRTMDMQNEGALFFSKNQSCMCAKAFILPLFLNVLGMVENILAQEWGVWCVIFLKGL